MTTQSPATTSANDLVATFDNTLRELNEKTVAEAVAGQLIGVATMERARQAMIANILTVADDVEFDRAVRARARERAVHLLGLDAADEA